MCFLRLEVIFKAFMMVFSVMNLSCLINAKVKKLLVTFVNIGQGILLLFFNLGQVRIDCYYYCTDFKQVTIGCFRMVFYKMATCPKQLLFKDH